MHFLTYLPMLVTKVDSKQCLPPKQGWWCIKKQILSKLHIVALIRKCKALTIGLKLCPLILDFALLFYSFLYLFFLNTQKIRLIIYLLSLNYYFVFIHSILSNLLIHLFKLYYNKMSIIQQYHSPQSEKPINFYPFRIILIRFIEYLISFKVNHQYLSLNFYYKQDIILMINKISQAKRLTGIDKPTVWSIMTPLAVKTKSINLGQGSPSWEPPNFYLENLQKAQKQSNHQYTRSYGSLPLVESIANFHKRFPKLNPQTQIVAVQGAGAGLLYAIVGFVDQGDQVLFFDPSYDWYRAQIQMAGGKSVGIPLKPKHQQTKAMLIQRCKTQYKSSEADEWEIDYQLFEKSINEKTKMLILNSPHNPVGKVFTQEELAKISKILQKYPRIVILEDNVYQGMTFDDMLGKDLPKIAFQKNMYDRTLSIYSAGKIFAATGVRSGWVIGNSDLIRSVRSVHQYSVFCTYNVIENTIAKSLQWISRPEDTYIKDCAQKLTKNRNLLLDELIASKFDFELWIPKGGYFILADISKVQVQEKYFVDEQGNKMTKDYAFCIQLASEEGVVAIPCSSFYSKEDSHLGERYVRFAFCKDESLIKEAGKRMK